MHWLAYLSLLSIFPGRDPCCLHFTNEGAVFKKVIYPRLHSSHGMDPGSDHRQAKSVNRMLNYYVLSLTLVKRRETCSAPSGPVLPMVMLAGTCKSKCSRLLKCDLYTSFNSQLLCDSVNKVVSEPQREAYRKNSV